MKNNLSDNSGITNPGKRYIDFFESSPIGYIVLDGGGHICEINTLAAAILGRGKDEILHKPLLDFLTDQSQAAFTDHKELVLRTRAKQICDLQAHGKNGLPIHIHVESTAGENSSGAPEIRLGLIDFTRYFKDREILNESRERMRLRQVADDDLINPERIVEAVRTPLMVLDMDLKVVLANKAFYSTFKVSQSETMGCYFHELGNGQWNISPLLLMLNEVLPHNLLVRDFMIEHEFPDIGRKVMLINATKINQPDRDRQMILLSIEDITDRMKMEDALRARNAELAAVNRELEAFSYSTSHDLRAPLRTIDGFSMALLEDYGEKLEDKAKSYLNRICAATIRMAGLIDDLLILSKITRAEIKMEMIDLSDLSQSIIENLQKTQPNRAVEFSFDKDIIIKGDYRLIKIAIENLLGNAWKFTGYRENAKIELRMGRHDGEPVYLVCDNGAGFDMTYADRIFMPFQRLHTTAEFSGSGIGLAIVERVIRRHNGTIWAESKVDVGTTMYFTLPNK